MPILDSQAKLAEGPWDLPNNNVEIMKDYKNDPFECKNETDCIDYFTVIYNWSYTINISTKKRLRNFGVWGNMSNQKQEEYLDVLMADVYKNVIFKDEILPIPSYRFELTELMNTHLHGTIQCTRFQIQSMQNYIHKICGLPKLEPKVVCFVDATYYHEKYWETYKNKEFDDEGSWYPSKPIGSLISGSRKPL